MAILRLSLLGSFQLTLGGEPVAGIKSNKTRALLAYLAVEGDRAHRREALAGLLWPDWPDRAAFSNLRYTLSNLRTCIRDAAAEPSVLLISRDSLQFNAASNQWVDVAHFMALAGEGRKDAGFEKLEAAVALYRGPFLEGFSVGDSAAFDDWAVSTREQLARELSSALHLLAERYQERGDFQQAQLHARHNLALQPWDETAHRQVMRILAMSGERSAALSQYQTCRRLLAEELKVEPGEETRQLFEHIRDGDLKPLRQEAVSVAGVEEEMSTPEFLRRETVRVEPPVFVARQKELQRLNQMLDAAMSGNGQVAFVTGEAGSGKTALLQAFARQEEETQPKLVAVSGDCSAYTGIGDPYLPFRMILELLTGDVEARWAAGTIRAEQARRLWATVPLAVQVLVERGPNLVDTLLPRNTLSARLSDYGRAGSPWMQELENLLERKPQGRFGYVPTEQSDLFEEYTRVLQGLAQHRPLLILIDDLQWADPGSINLVFHLGRHLEGSRILIVGAYRPEEVALTRQGERHPLDTAVNELSRVFGDILVNVDVTEGKAFVDAYLASEPNRLGDSFRDMLLRQTLGNPLFTVELLRGLQERGDLVKDPDGHWIEGKSLDWDALPARVEAAIRERIRRLPDDLHRALEVASVEGQEFTAEMVAKVCGSDEDEMRRQLSAELDRKHRIVEAHAIQRLPEAVLSRFRFRHILFQKYLYGSLDEVERPQLHEQVGSTLESLYASEEAAPTHALQLARHFEHAGITRKAIEYLQRAGDEAVRLSAYSQGHSHLQRALELLESLPPSAERSRTELALQFSLGRACMSDVLGSERQKCLARCRELCSETGKAAEFAHVLGEQSIFHYVRAELAEALKLAEEALALSQEADDPLLIALGHWRLGFIQFSRGEFMASRAHLSHILSIYEPQKHHPRFVLVHGADAGMSAMAYDACSLWALGYPEHADAMAFRAIKLAREFKHTFSLADVLCYAGCLYSKMKRETSQLEKYSRDLVAVGTGSSFAGSGTCFHGDAIAHLGQVQEGIEQVEAGLAARRAKESFCAISSMWGSLGEAYVLAGDIQAGLGALDGAFKFVETSGERNWEPELHRLRGEFLLQQGAVEQAETSLMKSIEVARAQQAKSWELRAATSLARVWRGEGRGAEARDLLEPIYNWFTEGFDTPDLVEARQLLEELTGADLRRQSESGPNRN
jgi:DNA-binding SARP family transcriptional activator/predicted ATPase